MVVREVVKARAKVGKAKVKAKAKERVKMVVKARVAWTTAEKEGVEKAERGVLRGMAPRWHLKVSCHSLPTVNLCS